MLGSLLELRSLREQKSPRFLVYSGIFPLLFDIGDVTQSIINLEFTERNLVSITAKFFNSLRVVSPVTILFKMFCQQLCEGWDGPLSAGTTIPTLELLSALLICPS